VQAADADTAMAYCASKALTEKTMWAWMEAEKPGFTMATINPPVGIRPARRPPQRRGPPQRVQPRAVRVKVQMDEGQRGHVIINGMELARWQQLAESTPLSSNCTFVSRSQPNT
jgi:hypothetical protein